VEEGKNREEERKEERDPAGTYSGGEDPRCHWRPPLPQATAAAVLREEKTAKRERATEKNELGFDGERPLTDFLSERNGWTTVRCRSTTVDALASLLGLWEEVSPT
jgi:hypothetical protein